MAAAEEKVVVAKSAWLRLGLINPIGARLESLVTNTETKRDLT